MRYAENLARELHRTTCDARREQGHGALTPEDPLKASAHEYAHDLAGLGQLTHDHGGRPAGRVAPYRGPAENLARVERRGSPADVARYITRKWRRSKLHRRNLMAEAATYHGLGVWQRGGELFVVQLLAEKKPLRRYAADVVSSIRG
jgi:uncharacterized protein YkwD